MAIKAGTVLRRVHSKGGLWTKDRLYKVDKDLRIYSDLGMFRLPGWIEMSIEAGVFEVVPRMLENEE